jgi:hypothetical protein
MVANGMNHRRCRQILLLGILASCTCTYVGIRLMGTDRMTIEDAMDLIGKDLTEQQRKVVAAVLRRQTVAAVRQLVLMAKINDVAGIEATEAVRQLREVLK